jgi:drug/metabolite transporter (DMT)-like permease
VACSLLGIVGNQVSWATGLHLSTAVDLSLILGVGPVLAALGYFWMAGRKPSRRQLAALVLGFAGVVLIVLQTERGAGGNLAGDLIGLGAPITWAVYLVLLTKVTPHTTATVFLAWIMLLGTLPLAVLAYFEVRSAPDPHWYLGLPALAYSALLATGIAYALYFWALPRIGVTGTAIYSYLQPPLGAVLGAVFLMEPFGPVQIAGAVVIVAAAYLGNSRGT